MYDSSACERTSKPLAATTAAGSVAVTSGSMTARVGRSRREAMAVFAWRATRSKTAMPVHSLPVPQVVGQAMWGFNFPGIGFARPIGALMYAISSSGY